MIIETILGLVLLTAPAADTPQTYIATSGETALGYSAYAGWVPYGTCHNRCVTVPGQPAPLLRGEIAAADLADLLVSVWRLDGPRWVPVVHCARWFGGAPLCADWSR